MTLNNRVCQIVFAGIGTSDEDLLPIINCDDGAYDLHDVVGSPVDVGHAIAESLATSDIMRGRDNLLEDRDQDLYLTIKIKFGGSKKGIVE